MTRFRSVVAAVVCALMMGLVYAEVVRAWDSPASISEQTFPADQPSIARDDDHVFIVWAQNDGVEGDTDIWIRVNVNGGSGTWQDPCKLYDNHLAQFPLAKDPDVGLWDVLAIASPPGMSGPIYVVWAEQVGVSGFDPLFDILALRIDTWTFPCSFTVTGPYTLDGTPNSRASRVAVDSQYAQIVWVSDTAGVPAGYELWHVRWSGGAVPPTTRLTTGYSWDSSHPYLSGPDVAVSSNPDSTVNVVWECNPAGTAWEIYALRNTNRGDPSSWPAASACSGPISGGTGTDSVAPSLADFQRYVHVSWTDYRESQGVIFYRRSQSGGVSWNTEMRISSSFNPPTVGRSAIAACGLCVGIVWSQRPGTTDDLVFRHSLSSGDVWLPSLSPETVTSGPDNDVLPAIATDRLTGPTTDFFRASYHIAFKRIPTVGPPNIQYFRRFSGESSYLAWTQTATRWGTSAAFNTVQTGWIFGGWSGPLTVTCEITSFDTVQRTMASFVDPLPTAYCAETSAVWVYSSDSLVNGAYIFGGRSATGSSSQIFRFIPGQSSGQRFPTQAPFATARFGTSAVYPPGGVYAYVFGGLTAAGGTYLDEIVRVSTQGSAPTTCAVTLPSGRVYTSAVWNAAAARAYVIGGLTASGDTDEVLEFDPATCTSGSGSLPVVARLPGSVEGLGVAPRYATSAVFDDTTGLVYVFGGECCAGATRFDTVVRVRVGIDMYGAGPTMCLTMPTARAHTSAVWNPTLRDAFVFFGTGDAVSQQSIVQYEAE